MRDSQSWYMYPRTKARPQAEAKVKEEGATVDVVTIDQIPVFDSDSEDENAVHVFQFKI